MNPTAAPEHDRTAEEDRGDDGAELRALVEDLGQRLSGHALAPDPWGLGRRLEQELGALQAAVAQGAESSGLLREHQDRIRAMYRGVALLQTGDEWHSARGSLEHPIRTLEPLWHVPGFNDYQRGFLPWLGPLERHFSAVSQPHLRGRALLFGSGMGAVQCALQSVLGRCKRMVLGRRVYYETQSLLALSGLVERLSPLDEGQTDPERLAKALEGADAIFLDTVTLDPLALRLDFERLYRAIVRSGRARVELVVDNTVPGPALAVPPAPAGVRLFVVESLLKSYQAGLDLAACGMLVVAGSDDDGADAALVHELEVLRSTNGTNITPISARMLPLLPRRVLLARLRRQVNNAAVLAEALRPHGAVAEVGYAGLVFVTHPEAEALVAIIERLALARRVVLHRGTSFGFNTTRVAVVPGSGSQVRFACGMEDLRGVARIARVARHALLAVDSPEIKALLEPLERFFEGHPRSTVPRPEQLSALERHLQEFDERVVGYAGSS